MKALGIILVVVGLVGLLYGGVTWKKPETVVDIGSVKVTHDKTESVRLPPIAGGLCLVAGTVILLLGGRRTA